jgi:TetR/AcrR family acrAB operon transcriptional repressor
MKRTQEDAAQTRQAVLNAALSIFSRQSYAAARLEDIAAEAGVTRGAIYHHFGSKAGLFNALIDEASASGGAVVQAAIAEGGSFTAIVQRVLERSMAMLEENTRFREVMALSLFQSSGIPELEPFTRQRAEQALTQVQQLAGFFQAGIAQGALRPELDPTVAARAFLAYQDGLAVLWLSNREAFSIKAQAGALATVFLQGIAVG